MDNEKLLSDISVCFKINADLWRKLKQVQNTHGLDYFSAAIKMTIHKGLEVINSGR